MIDDNLNLWTNGIDVFAALSVEHAKALWSQFSGESLEDYDDDWLPINDDVLHVAILEEYSDLEDLFPEKSAAELAKLPKNKKGWRVSLRAAEWARRNGPGFVSSTEF